MYTYTCIYMRAPITRMDNMTRYQNIRAVMAGICLQRCKLFLSTLTSLIFTGPLDYWTMSLPTDIPPCRLMQQFTCEQKQEKINLFYSFDFFKTLYFTTPTKTSCKRNKDKIVTYFILYFTTSPYLPTKKTDTQHETDFGKAENEVIIHI